MHPALPATDPTAVMGRRITAYLLDGLLGLLVMIPLLIGIFHANSERTVYASDSQASAACDEINAQTADGSGSTDVQFNTTGFTGSSSHPICLPIGNTTYVVRSAAMQRSIKQLSIAQLAITLGNLVVLQGLVGASVGKLILGLRVVKPDGSTARMGACLGRWIGLAIDSACFLIGLLTASNSKGHRRIGDMLADTMVVRKGAVGSPIQVPGMTQPQQATPAVYQPPATTQVWGPTPPTSPTGGGVWPQLPPPPAQAPTFDHDGPHWDEARDTYIRYDRTRSAWLMWDSTTNDWVPISQ